MERDYGSDLTIQVEVAKKVKLSADIYVFAFKSIDGSPLPGFDPGTHIDVHIAEGLVRQYSLFNGPEEKDLYQIGVLREETGRGGSKTLCDNIGEGDRVRVSYPRNNFRLSSGGDYYLLLAGGIGITPIFAIARQLQAEGIGFELHYSVRSRSHAAFLALIETCGFPPGSVHLHCDDKAGLEGLDLARLANMWRPGLQAYVCGPSGYMNHVIDRLSSQWPKGSIHLEKFAPDEVLASNAAKAPFTALIKSTGETFKVGVDETLADALAKRRHPVNVSCEQGLCGSCILHVISGEILHNDSILSQEERDDERLMTPCVSRGKQDEVLILDI